MEGIVKKYQQKFKRLKEEMNRWDDLQSRLIVQFRNASSIIERLQVVQDCKNYSSLNSVAGVQAAVLRKQMESLQTILLSMKKTLEEFRGVVFSFEKLYRDGRQLVKGGSNQLTVKQLQQRVGVKPCLADCLDGLMILHDMHYSDYLLKSSLVSALSELALKPSTSDLGALQQLLVDQPNIPKEEGRLLVLKYESESKSKNFQNKTAELYVQHKWKNLDSDWKQIMAAAKWHILGYSCNLSLKLYLLKRLIDICKAAVEVNIPDTEYLDVEWNCGACFFLADVSTEECL